MKCFSGKESDRKLKESVASEGIQTETSGDTVLMAKDGQGSNTHNQQESRAESVTLPRKEVRRPRAADTSGHLPTPTQRADDSDHPHPPYLDVGSAATSFRRR